MWKVKRMNTARIVVLAIAIVAGALAAYLASGPAPQPTAPVALPQTTDTTDVLIAKSNIALGQVVQDDVLQWQAWPLQSAGAGFIKRTERPEAINQIRGMIARSPFVAGEPIREQKLVSSTGSGFMAAILPSGMRAVATEIAVETAAGGFVLPNDRVDVILTTGVKKGENTTWTSRTVVEDVRVLAVDQTIEDKDNQKSVVGRTATIEVTPEQAEILANGRQAGRLTLALRSMVDVNQPRNDGPMSNRNINIVRFGTSNAKP